MTDAEIAKLIIDRDHRKARAEIAEKELAARRVTRKKVTPAKTFPLAPTELWHGDIPPPEDPL